MRQETILDVYPGATDRQRLVVASESCDSGCAIAPETLVLRQESFSDHVGWFVQSRISVEPAQLDGLRTLLTGRVRRPAPARGVPCDEPAVLKFPTAG